MDAQPDIATAPWPLDPYPRSELSEEAQERISALVARSRRSEHVPPASEVFGADIAAGYVEAPLLILEDHATIELMPPERAPLFEYRSYGLARAEDFVLLSRSRVRSFEDYTADKLGLGRPTVLRTDRGDPPMFIPLAKSCLRDEDLLAALAQAARQADALNISPYISTGHHWLLGAEIARRSGRPVRLCAPEPRLARRANDKLWFASQIRALFGKASLPPTYSVFGPAAAAAVIQRLARHHTRVVAKLPSSAGSMGNIVFESDLLRRLTLRETRAVLLDRLRALGWTGRYPFLIGVWETRVVASPSVQIWVPEGASGPPIIEGLFAQTLAMREQIFIGAASIDLPEPLQQQVLRQATMIGTLFQRLGYFGRLSLDALLVGDDLERARLDWIECNARWGGVSLPMTIAHRLGVSAKGAALSIVQRGLAGWQLPDFERLARAVAPLLYSFESREGIAFIEPTGPYERGLSFFAVGQTAERCDELVAATIETALSLSTQIDTD